MIKKMVIVFCLCYVFEGAVAGGTSIDFRSKTAETNGWTLTGTSYSSDRGRKLADLGAYIQSPEYAGSITSLTVVTYCSGARIDTPFVVGAGTTDTAIMDCMPGIEYVNIAFVTNVFTFAESAGMHCFRIRLNAQELVNGSYYVTSVDARWVGGPLQPPTNVHADNVETNAFVVRWTPPDDAESCRAYVWTNVVVGACAGTAVWSETFANALAKSGAAQAISSGTLHGYCDSVDDSRYWELDHVYPSVDAGALRIGGTETNGWMTTPHLPRGEGLTLHLRARRQNSDDGTDMPVKIVTGGQTQDVAIVRLTSEFADYHLALPTLEEGDSLVFHSTTNKKSTRVIVDTIRLLEGYDAGTVQPDWIVNGVTVVGDEYAVSGLRPQEYVFSVEAVRGGETAGSPTGRVDLAEAGKPKIPNAVPFSEVNGCEWWCPFDYFAVLFPGTGNTCAWVNGLTLGLWQAWWDGVPPDSVTRNKGAVANGGLYAYWTTNETVASYALGLNVGSKAQSCVVGVVFVNDLSVELDEFALSYVGLQFGFQNKAEQYIECEWLVTNELVSVAAEGAWRSEPDLVFRTPAVGLGETLKGGTDLPRGGAVSAALRGLRLRPGEYLLLRWRREQVTNAAALAIDDVRLSFRRKARPTVFILR